MAPSDRMVVRFIRDDLGCGCPDEVLQTIRIDRHWPVARIDAPLARIDVGGRLLVWVVDVGERQFGIAELVTSAVAAGLDERDRLSFNRFRVVLASGTPSDITRPARQAFDACRRPDDRVHLHVLDLRSLPATIRPIRAPAQS